MIIPILVIVTYPVLVDITIMTMGFIGQVRLGARTL